MGRIGVGSMLILVLIIATIGDVVFGKISFTTC